MKGHTQGQAVWNDFKLVQDVTPDIEDPRP